MLVLKKVVVVATRITVIRRLEKSVRRVRNMALLSLLTLPALAHAYQVIGIADGDTLTVLVDQRPLKIRLANVDAPVSSPKIG